MDEIVNGMRRLTLLIFIHFCVSLSAQDYFQIKKNGNGHKKKIWLDEISYTIVTTNTVYNHVRILDYNDSAIWVSRYRFENHIHYPDSVSVPLKEINQIIKKLDADYQARRIAGILWAVSTAGIIVSTIENNGAALAFVFLPIFVGSTCVFLVGNQLRYFDMRQDWTFEPGVHHYPKRSEPSPPKKRAQ